MPRAFVGNSFPFAVIAPEERHVYRALRKKSAKLRRSDMSLLTELDGGLPGESINMARLRRYGAEGSGKSFWLLLTATAREAA